MVYQITSMIKPLPLKPGDTIGIAAVASPFDAVEFEKGVATLKRLGFKTKFRKDLFAKKAYLAGPDSRRAEELMEHFQDPEVKAIFFARGGYGTLRIMPLLDYALIQKNPKIVMGYSDMTVLLNYLTQSLKWVTFQGPVVAKGMGDSFQERGQNSLLRTLTQSQALGEVSNDLVSLREGNARGTLVGGCLSVITASLKTPYEMDTQDKILFLEDTNEKPYALDRMLTQLRLAGKLNQVRGFIFGPFQNSGASAQELQEALLNGLGDLNVPIVFGFPSGHLENMLSIPLGTEVELSTQKRSVCFKEGALKDGLQ